MQDTQGLDLELRYLQDVDGWEVDFVLTEGRKMLSLITSSPVHPLIAPFEDLRMTHTRDAYQTGLGEVLPLIECKWGDAEVGRSLKYMQARFPEAEAWQISATGTRDYVTPEGIRVCPATVLLGGLI